MNKRPRSVTFVSWLFVAAGAVGVAYHASELTAPGAFDYRPVWVLIVRLLAIVAGLGMLRGANWARWLALAWMAYHVGLSALHSVPETVMHLIFLAGIAYLLLNAKASSYFRS